MTNRSFSGLATLAGAGLLSACAQTTPQLDRGFGAAVRIAVASQVADPAAVANPNPGPIAGMDGRSARAAFERYQKSFTDPAPQPMTFMIGGGGAK